jgi:hypothetical protein
MLSQEIVGTIKEKTIISLLEVNAHKEKLLKIKIRLILQRKQTSVENNTLHLATQNQNKTRNTHQFAKF